MTVAGHHDDPAAQPPHVDPAAVASIRREQLARYLRTQRSRIKPEDAGQPRPTRRRVPGLRRYEVAQLAGVSDTWYTWLEQARDIKVSSDALDSIARALRLDEQGRRHIRRLAGIPVVEPDPPVGEYWRPDYASLLEQLLPWPATITTVSLDLVAWNRSYALVVRDPMDLPEGRRNTMLAAFSASFRDRVHDWERVTRSIVARFQFESGNYPDDPRFGELVSDLTETSAEFSEYWNSGVVRPSTEPVVVFEHPSYGTLRLVGVQMRLMDSPRLVVTAHHPADAETEVRLQELLDRDRAGVPLPARATAPPACTSA